MVPTHGNLESALSQMSWRFEPGTFALLGFLAPPSVADLELLSVPPAQIVTEAEQTTLLIPSDRVEEALRRHPEAEVEGDLIWVRFDAPMSWDVVGFLALVTGHFAAAGIPIGAVCGFRRDHLFLARRHQERARAVLTKVLACDPE
ncbi:MAG: hypothetical protein CMJ85_09685 [Planctomycetes bacterium]|nr:hypothetical protein [Planctomycetota bacterium]